MPSPSQKTITQPNSGPTPSLNEFQFLSLESPSPIFTRLSNPSPARERIDPLLASSPPIPPTPSHLLHLPATPTLTPTDERGGAIFSPRDGKKWMHFWLCPGGRIFGCAPQPPLPSAPTDPHSLPPSFFFIYEFSFSTFSHRKNGPKKSGKLLAVFVGGGVPSSPPHSSPNNSQKAAAFENFVQRILFTVFSLDLTSGPDIETTFQGEGAPCASRQRNCHAAVVPQDAGGPRVHPGRNGAAHGTGRGRATVGVAAAVGVFRNAPCEGHLRGARGRGQLQRAGAGGRGAGVGSCAARVAGCRPSQWVVRRWAQEKSHPKVEDWGVA